MEPGRLIDRYPVLYHMAEDGSWESIRRSGLLSANSCRIVDVGFRENTSVLKNPFVLFSDLHSRA